MTNIRQTQFLERIERTPSSVSYRFTKPENFNFIAGQYMLVDLSNDLVHPLTLSNCPEETRFIEFTKRMTGSPYCYRLESLKKKETISIKGPFGKFYLSDSNEDFVMIAGGIGITPFRSILSSLEKKKANIGPVTLIYGNLNRDDIAFRNELENLSLPNYRLIHVLSDTTGIDNAYQGFITADILSKEVPQKNKSLFMISGPPSMVEAIRKALATINVAEDKILTDIFFGYND